MTSNKPKKPEIVWIDMGEPFYYRSYEKLEGQNAYISINFVIKKIEELKKYYVKYIGTELIHWLKTIQENER
ncbi:MAG TPA: hypothetical protein PLO52_00400 [Flavobacterium alvei]|nr:hypothetical protein [Flavobacterium alvei]